MFDIGNPVRYEGEVCYIVDFDGFEEYTLVDVQKNVFAAYEWEMEPIR